MSGLKYANTPPLYALTALGIAFSFFCMMKAVKVLEVGVAYSVFVGLGTTSIVLAEYFYYHLPLNPLKLLFITAIFISVFGLKCVAR